MSDIKSVLSLLCQHLNLSINVPLKPEYFRLAKFDESAESVTQTFWHVLDILSFYVVKRRKVRLDLRDFDTHAATKLRFAYLQYQTIEFYCQSKESGSNRQLLLAFAWLLGTQNVMDIVVQDHLGNSRLGRECTQSKANRISEEAFNSTPESLVSKINMFLDLNGKINCNIKEISELLSEKAKLVAKVHAASTNASGLPHLSVSELILIKNLSEGIKNLKSRDVESYTRELRNMSYLLDVHMKWVKKEPVFFEWMVTVIEEHNKPENCTGDLNWHELLNFTSLLHSEIKTRLNDVSPNDLLNRFDDLECSSRFLRAHSGTTEAEIVLKDTTDCLNKETENLHKRKEEIRRELKDLLKLIPACAQI